MSKRFIIDGNGPGRVMVIDAEKADALMEYILQEGGNPYEITKAKATSFVFEGWDECGETVYWSVSHCEWFDRILGFQQKEREEQRKFDMEELKMEEFSHCEWFDRILGRKQKEKEEEQQREEEDYYMDKFARCDPHPYDDMEEPPVRKNKRMKGGGWVPLVARG